MKWVYLLTILMVLTSCKESSSSSSSDSSSSSGPTYYVSQSSGNDASAGTSTSAPWKTLSKVEGFSFPDNSTVYLKRGDTWYESLTIPASYFTIDAYGTGTLPVLDGSYTATLNWADEGSNVYSSIFTVVDSLKEGLGNITRNAIPANFLGQVTANADNLNASADNTFSFDSTTDTLFLRSNSDPTSDTFKISWLLKGIDAVSVSNINIKNIRIQHFSLHGIEFKNCTNCSATGVEVQQIGGAVLSGTLQAGNGIEYGGNCSGGTVDSVTVTDIFDSCLSPQTYASNQTIENITFQNSTVSKCGFAGVEVSVLSNGGSTGSQINNTSIDNLNISFTGQGWSGRRYGTEGYGIRIQADAGAGSISNTSIKETEIEDATSDGIRIIGKTGTTSIARSKLSENQGYGITVYDINASSDSKLKLQSSIIAENVNFGVTFYCTDCVGLEAYHNTFYENSLANIWPDTNVYIDATSDMNVLKNNLFDATSDMVHLYSKNNTAGTELDYNCYSEQLNTVIYKGTAYSAINDFHSAFATFEANGIGGEPGLNDPAAGDFTLKASSDCLNTGTPGLGVTLDYAGNAYDSATPSAGALQDQ